MPLRKKLLLKTYYEYGKVSEYTAWGLFGEIPRSVVAVVNVLDNDTAVSEFELH